MTTLDAAVCFHDRGWLDDRVNDRAQYSALDRVGQSVERRPVRADEYAVKRDVAVECFFDVAAQLDNRSCRASFLHALQTWNEESVADEIRHPIEEATEVARCKRDHVIMFAIEN